MKIRNQARLCQAVSDLEPQILFSICFELSREMLNCFATMNLFYGNLQKNKNKKNFFVILA